jgi:antitoxin (DNA-binding transcriptional repressor) of toxin-antitoxin stability system
MTTMADRRIGAAQFKEQCLQLLEELGPEGLVITKRGKPVARLLPFERSGAPLIGALKHQIRVRGEITSTNVSWEVDEKHS